LCDEQADDGSRGHPPTCCEISIGECLQSLPAGSVLHPAPQLPAAGNSQAKSPQNTVR
jgi:hypothetical protein